MAIIIGRKIDGHLTKLLASKLISLLFTIFCLPLMVGDDDGEKLEKQFNNNGNFAIAIATSK